MVHHRIRIAKFSLCFVMVKDLNIVNTSRRDETQILKRKEDSFTMMYLSLEIVGYFLIKIKESEMFNLDYSRLSELRFQLCDETWLRLPAGSLWSVKPHLYLAPSHLLPHWRT